MPKTPKRSTGVVPPMGKATVKQVAALAGVSLMTVSRAINAPQTVSEPLRTRVLEAVQALGYIPNKAAAGLQSARSRMIGFLMPQLSVPFYHQLHVGMTNVLEPKGYNVLVVETRYDAAREAALAEMLVGWRPSGVVRVPTGQQERADGIFQAAGIPVCEFVDSTETQVALGVGYSHEEAGRAIGEHLMGRGYRHIGMVMPPAVPRFRQQLQGIRHAARGRVGVQVSGLEPRASSPLTMEDGAAMVRKLQQESSDIDALVFLSDVPAVGALLESQRLGIEVPRQLALVGFGDYEIASHINPSLTSLHVDGFEIGAACARLLLERIENPASPNTVIPVRFRLVQRSTT